MKRNPVRLKQLPAAWDGLSHALIAIFCALTIRTVTGAQSLTPQLSVSQSHLGGVTKIASAPNTSWIASLGSDNSICIWNAADGKFLAKYTPRDANSRVRGSATRFMASTTDWARFSGLFRVCQAPPRATASMCCWPGCRA